MRVPCIEPGCSVDPVSCAIAVEGYGVFGGRSGYTPSGTETSLPTETSAFVSAVR